MKLKLALALGASAAVFAGVSIHTRQPEAAPFINPVIAATTICGGPDALAARRAFFVQAASAYAAARQTAPAASLPAGGKIGDIAYAVTTEIEQAQTQFNRGVAFMWNFNHAEAVKAFKAAQAADPNCAMCFWGEALALGPNINAPMAPEANAPAWAATEKALSLRSNASEKEQALITALGYRYSANPPDDRAKLDEAYAQQMGDVAKRFPDDDFIAVAAAEANMDMQAWDYWELDGRTPKGRTGETISLIEGVLARSPNHPAAIHLYIHITEATNDPYRAEPFADKLGDLTPGLGHLIHMPSHTYYRVGDFKKSLASNILAVAADEAYLADADASILYEYGYYTHNVHFALTSAQMAGDAATAIAMAAKLDEKLPIEMAEAAPFVQPIKAAPYYTLAQFNRYDDIMALEDPGDAMPFLQGAWRYARGEAYARAGDAEKARAEAEAIGALINQSDLSGLVDSGVPALDILNIARRVVIARAALSEEDYGGAVEALEEAVALQEGLSYMEPPYWYYPVKQTLGAALIMAGEHRRAEQLFVEALAENPNNGWVLFGLAQTYHAQGDKSAKKYADALFREAWTGDRKSLSLEQL